MKTTVKVLALVVAMCASSCTVERVVFSPAPPHPRIVPPPHAKAWRVRRRIRHTYIYYPSLYVYYDPTRHLYFYLQGGKWIAAPSLPAELSLKITSVPTVKLEMETDKPYLFFEEHKKLHPPVSRKRSHRKQKRD